MPVLKERVNTSEELERMIIAGVIVRGYLEPWERRLGIEPFAFTPHKQMWGAILELDEDGEPIDTISVHRRASRDGGFLYGIGDVSKLLGGIPGDTKQSDIDHLRELHNKRKMGVFADRLKGRVDGPESVNTIIEAAEGFFKSIREEVDRDGGATRHISAVMDNDVTPRLDAFVRGEGRRIPTGIRWLDRNLNDGVESGHLFVMGAAPKSGKSAMALQIARQVAEQGHPVYLLSREMLNEENGLRLLAQTSEYDANFFKAGMYQSVRDGLNEPLRRLKTLPMYLDDRSKSVADIERELKILRDGGVEIKWVVADYLQLLRSETPRGRTRADLIEEMIYRLKDIAMDFKIVVMAVSQFNRAGALSAAPQMSDFDGSSAIEKAGNVIMMWTLGGDVSEGPGHIEGRSIGFRKFWAKFDGASSTFEIFDV